MKAIKNNIKKIKKNRVGIFVTCRMKSSRLPQKALKKIGRYHSVELCLLNCKKIKNVNKVVLATSYQAADSILINKFKKKYNVFAGHPQDVIKRFCDASKKYKLDVIVRVTGDCPFVSEKIINRLINAHLSKKADMTYAKKISVGTSGEVYTVNALKFVLKKIKKALYSEYMPFYFLNNKKFFKINAIDLPKHLIRNYRLTLDYEEDLKMFNAMIKKYKHSIKKLSTQEIFNILDQNPQIAKINSNCKLIYQAKKFQNKIKKLTSFKNN